VYGGFALASGLIFAVDYVAPTGYAIWLAYVGLIFATVFIDDRRAPWLVAGFSTVLVFLKVLLNPSDVSPEVVLVNRSICVALLWIAAALLTREKEQSEEQVRVLSGKLQKQQNEQSAVPPLCGTHPAQQKAGIPVLLVDDHVMVRQGLRSVMEAFPNIEIVGEASNGNEALKLVEKRRPAVVLMDINMPKLNGIEATAKIKREHPDVAVIGLSVNAETANQEAMKKAGASLLLPKEGVVEELYNAIMTVSTELVSKRATPFHSSEF
jgi:CheY-like chemotaxis protein